MVRVGRTKELAIRARHRRLATVVRFGVLAMFAFAMVVYPIFGTLSPAANAAERVPGVTVGIVPSTLEVALGQAPGLTEAVLPPPSLDATAHFLAISSDYVVSEYLPDCDGSTQWEGTNGTLTDDSLCTLWDGVSRIRSDAAVALARLNHAFKLRFGRNLCIISSYRSIGDQSRVQRLKGRLAAPAGLSNHGWGLAIDVCPGDDKGEHKLWLDENGPAFGWENPWWATSIKWEPWHWEYVPGTEALGQVAMTPAQVEEYGLAPAPAITSTPNPTPQPTPAPQPTPSPS
jgi:hypothetical protein